MRRRPHRTRVWGTQNAGFSELCQKQYGIRHCSDVADTGRRSAPHTMNQDRSTPTEKRRSVTVLHSQAHQDSESDERRHNKKDAACPIKLACVHTTMAKIRLECGRSDNVVASSMSCITRGWDGRNGKLPLVKKTFPLTTLRFGDSFLMATVNVYSLRCSI